LRSINHDLTARSAAIATGAPSVPVDQTTLTARATTSRATVAARSLDECSARRCNDVVLPIRTRRSRMREDDRGDRRRFTAGPGRRRASEVADPALGRGDRDRHDLAGQDRRKRLAWQRLPSIARESLQRESSVTMAE